MKTKLAFTLRQLLIKVNVFISRITPEDALHDFFKSIRPVKTQHDLIRIGSDDDGGYLIPDDLNGIDGCFSPGVSITSDFELEIANRGIQCFMADFSVEGPQLQHKLFHFEKKFIGLEINDVFMTLEDWVSRNAPEQRDMILQMDIEGFEYDVIMNTSRETLKRFRIIVIEFHDLEQILFKLGCTLVNQSFKKLLHDFEIVHIHPNNIVKRKRAIYKEYEIPSVIEVTFLRKDRIISSTPTHQFPHNLDRPNSLEMEDHILPRCWHNQP